jgi:hypothetical protein
MDIIYSHVKEPLRKGKTPLEVFDSFREAIEKESVGPTASKAEAYNKLRFAIGLAWSEIRPTALEARNLAAKESARDAVEGVRSEIPPSYGHNSE